MIKIKIKIGLGFYYLICNKFEFGFFGNWWRVRTNFSFNKLKNEFQIFKENKKEEKKKNNQKINSNKDQAIK